MIKSPRTLRRLAPILALTLLGVTACGSSSVVTSPNDVLTVNGKGYPKTKFEGIADDLVKAGQFTATAGRLSTKDSQVIIKTLIQYEAFTSFIKDRGLKVAEADRTKVLGQAEADPSFAKYSKPLQDLLIELNLASLTLSKVTPPSESELRKLYTSSPASAGVLCMSHILVKTEAEARAVLADLDKGVAFAKEAAAKSIEPAAKTSGGALKNGDEDCIALAELQASFDKDFLIGAVAAKVGVPSGPVKSSFGYHIILNHKFDDVKDSVARIVAKDPGNTLLVGYLTKAKISVNSKYGRWVPALATIE